MLVGRSGWLAMLVYDFLFTDLIAGLREQPADHLQLISEVSG